MAFDWEDYLQFAHEIRNRPDEAAKRIAISRAYYCVFHKAKDYAQRNLNYNFRPDQPSHLQLWRCFENRGKSLKAVRDKGSSLGRRRTAADYDDYIQDIDRSLGYALEEAKQALYWLGEVEKGK